MNDEPLIQIYNDEGELQEVGTELYQWELEDSGQMRLCPPTYHLRKPGYNYGATPQKENKDERK